MIDTKRLVTKLKYDVKEKCRHFVSYAYKTLD